MKKLVIVILLIGVLTGAYMYFGWKITNKGLSVEEVLPEDPLVYMKLSDIASSIKKIQSTQMWQSLSKIDFDKLFNEGKVPPNVRMLFELIKDQSSTGDLVSDRFLNKEVVLAVYESKIDLAQLSNLIQTNPQELIESYLSSVAIVIRMPADVQAAEYVSRYYKKLGKDISTTTETYNDHEVRFVNLKDLNVTSAYTVINDLIILGVGDTAAKKAIDVYEGSLNALSKGVDYQKANKQFLPSSAITGFIKFERIMSSIKEIALNQIAKIPASDSSDKEKIIDNMKIAFSQGDGLELMVFSTQIGDVIKSQFNVVTNPNMIHPQYKPMYGCSAVENNSLAYAPKGILGYLWTNCLNLQFYWDQYHSTLLAQNSSASDPFSKIEDNLGLSFPYDIIPAFGTQFGFYLNDISVGVFPVPELTLFLEVKNQSVIEKLLGNLDDMPLVTLVDENYKGIDLKFVPLPVGKNVKPTYAMVGKYLFISTNLDFVKKQIDAQADSSLALMSDEGFKKVNFSLSDKNRDVQYFQIGALARKLDDVVGWSNKWITSKQEQQEAFIAGSQQRLEDVRIQIKDAEAEIENLESKVENLKVDIIANKKLELDTTVLEADLDDTQKKKLAYEADLLAFAEQEFELIQIVDGYKKQGIGGDLRRLYLDEFIYPVLNSLGNIPSYGSRVTFINNVIESGVFFVLE